MREPSADAARARNHWISLKFAERPVRFGKTSPFSPLLPWRLSKAHAWSATVLVDELNAGGLDCSNDLLGGFISAAEEPIEGL